MLKSFISKYKHSKVAAIEWHWLSEEHYVLKGMMGKMNKDQISFDSEFDGIGLSDLPEYIDNKTPIVLSITGYGILHKSIARVPDDSSKLLSQVLPNVEQAQFYYELNEQGEQNVVSILKQERLKSIYEAFRASDYSVLSINLGLYQIQKILPIIDLGYQIYDVGNYLIQADDEKIVHFELKEPSSNTVKLNIGSDKLSMNQLNSFATLWAYFVATDKPRFNDEIVSLGQEDTVFRQIFQKTLLTLLAGLFVLLLANTYYFSKYSETLEVQTAQLSTHNQQLIYLDSLKLKYNDIQGLQEKSTLLKSSKLSFYSDEIGRTIPDDIFLDELILFPARENSRNKLQQSYDFNPNIINIQASTKNSFAINKWISALEKLEWVDAVELLPFSRKGKGLATFVVKLTIK